MWWQAKKKTQNNKNTNSSDVMVKQTHQSELVFNIKQGRA